MKSRKTAIATALGCDIADPQQYQGTRGLYYIGDTYYTSRKAGSKSALPDCGYEWVLLPGSDWFTRKYGIEVFKADVIQVKRETSNKAL